MSMLSVYEKGDVARFKTVFRNEDDEVIEPDVTNGSHDVSIMIQRQATGEVVLSETQMEEVSETEFRYDWQTSEDTALGEYSVEITAKFGGNNGETFLERERFKVVDILDPNVGQ